MAARRRLMEMQELPSAYRRVEYLESSGTQYIATNYIPTITASFSYKFMFTNYYNGDAMILGFRPYFDTKRRAYIEVYNFSAGSGSWYGACGLVGYRNVALPRPNTNTIYESTMDSSFATFNGTSVAPNAEYQDNDGFPIALFAWNNNNRYEFLHPALRLYAVKFEDNGGTAANFIPCVRKSNSKPGMYDTVSKTFYTNAGTGEFIIPS